jgi:hypothetical protein
LFLDRSIWVFLGTGRFAAKTQILAHWILLDFLGFSRQNRDLSMGYAAKALKIFSRRFCLGLRRRDERL